MTLILPESVDVYINSISLLYHAHPLTLICCVTWKYFFICCTICFLFCLFLTCGSKSTAGGLTFRCKTSFQFEFKVTQPFYTIKKNRSSLIKLIGGVGSGDPRLVILLQTPGCSSIIYWTPPFTLTPHAYRWQLHVINCVSFCPGSLPALLSVSVSFAICLWHSDFGSGVTKPIKQQLLLLVVSQCSFFLFFFLSTVTTYTQRVIAELLYSILSLKKLAKLNSFSSFFCIYWLYVGFTTSICTYSTAQKSQAAPHFFKVCYENGK